MTRLSISDMRRLISSSHACGDLERACESPPDRRLRYGVNLGQFGHRLALGIAIGGNTDHFRFELLLAAELDALALGPLDAFLAAFADKLALEVGDTAHDRQHQPAVVRGRVAPRLTKAVEATGEAFQFVQDVVEVTARTRQAIQLRHHDDIARGFVLHRPVKISPQAARGTTGSASIGFSGAICGLSANFTAGSSQLMHWRSVRPDKVITGTRCFPHFGQCVIRSMRSLPIFCNFCSIRALWARDRCQPRVLCTSTYARPCRPSWI
jgi:hypothetical protein